MAIKQDFDNAALSFENISKVFNKNSINEVSLFDNFSLNMKQNEFLSIIGSNGSGKTSLLNILCGSIMPDSGSVKLHGREITKLSEHQRSSFIGRVFQNPSKGTCPHLTILENLALADNKGKAYDLGKGVNKNRRDYYKSQLELLQLGLENKVDLPVGSLSGGQRQALALLISTMTPIDLLVLDEHTAALDPKTSEIVMELTDKFIKEKHLTAIMVTHNLRFAMKYGNRLILMHEGNAILDIADEEKQNYDLQNILKIFNEISIECGN
ncbi:MAG: ATP-binding cassette domain-containing protein [Bacillota bacterium]|nr:ATP-binding cassette domain-containing protein [Bacillota bacterium]